MTLTATRYGDMTDAQAHEAMIFSAFLRDDIGPELLPEPDWGPIGEQVFDRTYSRPIYQRDPVTGEPVRDVSGVKVLEDWWTWARPTHDRNTESFAEMCRRVVQGNLAYAPERSQRPDEELGLFTLMYRMGGSPAGRHLWVTGTGLPYTRNCWSSSWGPRTSEHLRFAAMRLFEGGGVGSNYSNDLLATTAPVTRKIDVRITCRPDHPNFGAVATAAGDAFMAHPSVLAAALDPNQFIDSGQARDLQSQVVAELAARPQASETMKSWREEHEARPLVTVTDAREGWVAAWCSVIDAACGQDDDHGAARAVFDVSGVREYGAPLLTFGGQASGPGPLVTALLGIAKVLNAAATQRRVLSSLEAMSIDHLAASAVVAGGTRRSARMSLKHWADTDILDFIGCKSDYTMHWTTNISVETDAAFAAAVESGQEHATAVLQAIAVGMARDGEPGIVDTQRHSIGEGGTRIRITNPCSEASLSYEAGDESPGSMAGESCNLGSVNLDRFGTDIDGATAAAELVARFLYRATLKPYPGEDASRIEHRNRRIGVGIMGLHGWVLAHGVRLSDLPREPTLLDKLVTLRQATRRAADELADTLGLPRPVKTTAIAPTGSISQQSGTTPATNPVMFKFYIRNVRFEATNPRLAGYAAQGYRIEDDLMAANTVVVSFPVRDSMLDRFGPDLVEDTADLTFADYLELVVAVEGAFCGGGDGMAVSSTCQLPEGADATMVADQIKTVLGKTKGITAFPAMSRPQAPYIALTEQEFHTEVARLDTAARQGVTGGDSNDGQCATGACPIR